MVRKTLTNRTHEHDEQIRVARSRNRLRTRNFDAGFGSEYGHPSDIGAGNAAPTGDLQT